MPKAIGSPSVSRQRVLSVGSVLSMSTAARQPRSACCGWAEGARPHGHELVADVVDEHALVREHAVGEHAHHVADPFDRPLRAEPLADAAEAADVAEEERHFLRAALEQVGLFGQALRKLAREELFEADALFQRRLLLLQPGHAAGHRRGEQLDEHRLDFADGRAFW